MTGGDTGRCRNTTNAASDLKMLQFLVISAMAASRSRKLMSSSCRA